MNEAIEAANADELVAAAIGQLDAGADLVKLYMDGPGRRRLTVDGEPRSLASTEAVHGRGCPRGSPFGAPERGARGGSLGGVDSIEHGFDLDTAVAAEMAGRGTTLVSTLAVMHSWLSFGDTTDD